MQTSKKVKLRNCDWKKRRTTLLNYRVNSFFNRKPSFKNSLTRRTMRSSSLMILRMRWKSLQRKKMLWNRRMLNWNVILKRNRKIDSQRVKRKKGRRFKRLRSLERKCFIRLKRLKLIFLLLTMNNCKLQQDLQFYKTISWLQSSSTNQSKRNNWSTVTTKWKLKLKPWREIFKFIKKLRRN
jgi:hypothetical protein